MSIIRDGLADAISVMESMIVNEGQASVLEQTILPKFKENAQAPVEDGWTNVDCDPYCDFMSETVEAGNQIMEEAYFYAQELAELAEIFY